jgi:hypothetical protein
MLAHALSPASDVSDANGDRRHCEVIHGNQKKNYRSAVLLSDLPVANRAQSGPRVGGGGVSQSGLSLPFGIRDETGIDKNRPGNSDANQPGCNDITRAE